MNLFFEILMYAVFLFIIVGSCFFATVAYFVRDNFETEPPPQIVIIDSYTHDESVRM